jgi:hypothetical protein
MLTGIPEGSISHYYARFNRDPEKYQKIEDSSYQEPPRSHPQYVAMMALGLSNTLTNATFLIQRGELAKARDYLQAILLAHDLVKRVEPTLNNVDRKDMMKVMQHLTALVKQFYGDKKIP